MSEQAKPEIRGCIMDFPEAFEFIKQNAPDKETHHPKCSYRQAGMLCDCSIIWAEYYKRENATLKATLERMGGPVSDEEEKLFAQELTAEQTWAFSRGGVYLLLASRRAPR